MSLGANSHAVTRATARSAPPAGSPASRPSSSRCGRRAFHPGPNLHRHNGDGAKDVERQPADPQPSLPPTVPGAPAPRWPWSSAPTAESRAESSGSKMLQGTGGGLEHLERHRRRTIDGSRRSITPPGSAGSCEPAPGRAAACRRRRGSARGVATVAQPRRLGAEVARHPGILNGLPHRHQRLLEAQQFLEVGGVVQHLPVGQVQQAQPGGNTSRDRNTPARRTSSGTSPWPRPARGRPTAPFRSCSRRPGARRSARRRSGRRIREAACRRTARPPRAARRLRVEAGRILQPVVAGEQRPGLVEELGPQFQEELGGEVGLLGGDAAPMQGRRGSSRSSGPRSAAGSA